MKTNEIAAPYREVIFFRPLTVERLQALVLAGEGALARRIHHQQYLPLVGIAQAYLMLNLDMIIDAYPLPPELQAIAITINGTMLCILTAGATGSF